MFGLVLVIGLKNKGLSSTPGKSVAKVARLLGENRHRLNQHRGYSEEVITEIHVNELKCDIYFGLLARYVLMKRKLY